MCVDARRRTHYSLHRAAAALGSKSNNAPRPAKGTHLRRFGCPEPPVDDALQDLGECSCVNPKRILPPGPDDWAGAGAGARSLVTRPGSGMMSPWDPRAASHASRSTHCRRCPRARSPTPSPSRGWSAGRRPALRATGATTITHRIPAGPVRPCCGYSGGAPRIPTPHPEARPGRVEIRVDLPGVGRRPLRRRNPWPGGGHSVDVTTIHGMDIPLVMERVLRASRAGEIAP